MKKVLVIYLVILELMFFTVNIYAGQEQNDLSREKKLFRNYSGAGSTSVTSLCIEGYVFVLVAANISNTTTVTQVYEEKNGKVLPKRCE